MADHSTRMRVARPGSQAVTPATEPDGDSVLQTCPQAPSGSDFSHARAADTLRHARAC